jgi:o-succinylbenzoate synthase
LQRAGVVLELWDDHGHYGVGEASPLRGHSQESLDDCVTALTDIHQRMGDAAPDGWPLCPWLHSVPLARFAWESALCDLVARARGISVATLLGGQSLRAVSRNALVRDREEVAQALERGIRTLKLKVGDPQKEAEEELHFLRSLRREFGSNFSLRLDANGVWSLDEARHRLTGYAELAPEFVEQPCAPQELSQLGVCAVPWAADESLAIPSQIDTLLEAPGCVAWVLKPALLGLRRARELAVRAQQHGRGVVITHLLDGPIGLAAACELALSLPQPPLCCGLDGHPGLSVWPPTPIPQHQESAALIVRSAHSGLGFLRQGLPWT